MKSNYTVLGLVALACLLCTSVMIRTHAGLMESLMSTVESMDEILGTGYDYTGWATEKLLPQEGGPYHSWGPEGIDLHQVLRYTNFTFNKVWEGGNRYWYRPFAAFISIDKNNTPTMWIPRASISTRKAGAGMRMQIMMQHFQAALSRQLFQYKERYQALVTVLTASGSIPLLFDLSDYHSCPDPNYIVAKREFDYYEFAPNASNVPLFTLSRSPTCNHALPVPTYKTYEYALLGSGNSSWQEKMNEWEEKYPWHNKTAKLYWRGGCKYYRKMLVKKAFTSMFKQHLDIRPSGFCGKDVYDMVVQELAPQEESMQYKAVVDIDGTSWSERFPRLLCYNSAVVVVSVPEDYEEYFTVDLIPGVHFIPADMENVTYVAQMIMKPEHDEMLRGVVSNANKWCREHMVLERLNLDFLSVLNGYVEMLNRHDPRWVDEWNRVAASYANSTQASKAGPNVLVESYIEFPTSSTWDLESYTISS